MKDYELLAFAKEKQGSKDPVNDTSELLSGILKQHGGEIVNVESKGRRPLGYAVAHQREGQLAVFHVRLDPANLSKLTRALRLNGDVLTAMITKKDTTVPKLRLPQESRPIKKPTRGRFKPAVSSAATTGKE